MHVVCSRWSHRLLACALHDLPVNITSFFGFQRCRTCASIVAFSTITNYTASGLNHVVNPVRESGLFVEHRVWPLVCKNVREFDNCPENIVQKNCLLLTGTSVYQVVLEISTVTFILYMLEDGSNVGRSEVESRGEFLGNIHSIWWVVLLPSVLWSCWLGGRKGIRPVKNWVVGCWRGYLSGVRCWLA